MKKNNNKSNSEDILLVEDFLGNKKELSFKRIYEKYYDRIRVKLLIASKNEFLADDLVSEVFMKIYTKLNTFDSERAVLYTWISVIATNHYRDHLRKEEKEKNVVSLDNGWERPEKEYNKVTNFNEIFVITDATPIPSEALDKKERTDILKYAIAKSIKKQFTRDLVNLRYFEELSYEEIAFKKNVPLGSVKCKLFRARFLMKEYLEKISSKDFMLYQD